MSEVKNHFLSEELMVVAAVRYCTGRMTYIVGNCVEWIIQIWPELSENTKATIRRDIEYAFERDDEDRATDSAHKYLGHNCDRAEWEKVRALWKSDASQEQIPS